MSDVVIEKCECSHDFQDEKYGKGNRVHNRGKDSKRTCTVCGKEKKN